MSEPPDGYFVRRMLAERSLDAASTLYRRHWAGAWRGAYAVTGRRAMADDLAQEAFLRAFRTIDRFDPERPFAPWLHRIVVNLALNALRDERRLVALGDTEVDQEGAFDEVEVDPDLMAALAALSPERRTVVVLHHWFGYTTPQLAELLDTPEGTISSRLGRAMNELRTRLGVKNVDA